MIKTIRYLAEADNSRVLVVLDLKAAFQNVSRKAMLYSSAQTDADLAAIFSKWYTGTPRSTECTTILYTTKSVPTAGWIRVALCQREDFQLPLTPCLDQSWRSFAHNMTQALNSSPTWTTGTRGTKPQYLLQTVAVITAATITLTLSCLGGHLQIHGDTEPSPVVVGEQATMEKTTQRFQKIATTLADLNAEGLNVQTVNHLLTMYVGAASQHVLRMSFVPEQEAQNFDRQVIAYWSRLMHRDIASPLFFYLPSLVDLEWDLRFNATRLLHGARGSRSFSSNACTLLQFHKTKCEAVNVQHSQTNNPFHQKHQMSMFK